MKGERSQNKLLNLPIPVPLPAILNILIRHLNHLVVNQSLQFDIDGGFALITKAFTHLIRRKDIRQAIVAFH